MAPSHAKEIGVARRMHVAQLADRLLLRHQAFGLDFCKSLVGQRDGGFAQHEITLLLGPIGAGAFREGIAGVRRAEVNPRQRVLRCRRSVLQKQLHATVADLVAGGGDENKMRRPFLGGDGARQREKVGDAGAALADARVPAGHRRGDDDDRATAGPDLGDDVAADNIALVMALDVEGDRRA